MEGQTDGLSGKGRSASRCSVRGKRGGSPMSGGFCCSGPSHSQNPALVTVVPGLLLRL